MRLPVHRVSDWPACTPIARDPRRQTPDSSQSQRGSALFVVMGYLAVIMIMSGAFFALLHVTLRHGNAAQWRQVCLNVAEGGMDKALAELRVNRDAYRGEARTAVGDGEFSVEVTPQGRDGYRIVSTGCLRYDRFVSAQARITAEVTLGRNGNIDNLRWLEVKSW